MKKEKSNKCLFCYDILSEGETDFHHKCSKKFFGSTLPPELPYTSEEINELAEKVVRSQVTVTGVQPKLSLHLEKKRRASEIDSKSGTTKDRLTIVGLWGGYIFKPPTEEYPELPAIEDLTMHLAEVAAIKTVPHTLIRFKSNELAYITRRIDRIEKSGTRLPMEDMCQLTERLTEDKYRGSMEQIGKVIRAHSSNPGFDAITLFEITLFSFLVGNADMHLKNFSIIRTDLEGEDLVALAPAYDLVATRLVLPADKEQLALQMNGRKSNIGIGDFRKFAAYLGILHNVMDSSIDRIKGSISTMNEVIDKSFLSKGMKGKYKTLIAERAHILQLD